MWINKKWNYQSYLSAKPQVKKNSKEIDLEAIAASPQHQRMLDWHKEISGIAPQWDISHDFMFRSMVEIP